MTTVPLTSSGTRWGRLLPKILRCQIKIQRTTTRLEQQDRLAELRSQGAQTTCRRPTGAKVLGHTDDFAGLQARLAHDM